MSVLDESCNDILASTGLDFSMLLGITGDEFRAYEAEYHRGKTKYSKANLKNITDPQLKQRVLLRDLFWDVLDKCRTNNRGYAFGYEFYFGVSVKDSYEKLLRDKEFCLFLLIPVLGYTTALSELLSKNGQGVYEEILSLDAQACTPDVLSCFRLKMDAIKRLEDRVKGQVTQKLRIDQNSVNNININNRVAIAPTSAQSENNLETIREEIMKLERDLGLSTVLPGLPITEADTELLLNKAMANSDKNTIAKALEIDINKNDLGGRNDF
jgi:hypothetical protein